MVYEMEKGRDRGKVDGRRRRVYIKPKLFF